MLKFFKKYSVAIVFIISFVLDANYQILEHFITDPFWLNVVKGFGALCLAWFTGNKLQQNKNFLVDDIGGGGIKNPPKP